MFDLKAVCSSLVLCSVVGTCLVSQGVSAADEVSSSNNQSAPVEKSGDADSKEASEGISSESSAESSAKGSVANSDEKVDDSSKNEDSVVASGSEEGSAGDNKDATDANVDEGKNDEATDTSGAPTGEGNADEGEVADGSNGTDESINASSATANESTTEIPETVEETQVAEENRPQSLKKDGKAIIRYVLSGVVGAGVANGAYIGVEKVRDLFPKNARSK